MEKKQQLWLSEYYPNLSPQKVANYLRSRGVSLTLLRKLKQNQAILVNGIAVRSNYLLQSGDYLEVLALDEEPGLPAEEVPLDIIYADDYLLVVNKPAGMVAHPVKHYTSGTLANALAYHLCRDGHSRQVRLLHRLDKDTSGLLLVSLNPIIHHHLVRDLQNQRIHRIYWAFVHGKLPAAGSINAPLDPVAPGAVLRQVDSQGKPAITHYKTLKHWSNAVSLAEITLETGRTHQIRVHMAHIGHPLLGDQLYGQPNNTGLINRQALHARKLVFTHPVSKKVLILEAPLPEDLNRLTQVFDRYTELKLW